MKLPEDIYNLFRDLIYKESGISFCSVNRVVLESRLYEIVRDKEHNDYHQYYKEVLNNPKELKSLLDYVTTNLTRFFRNQGHFNALRRHVIPKLVSAKIEKDDKTFNFWSAGCSTGEEPYSIAMLLDDMLPKDFKIRVVASDLSLSCLMTAKEGRYKKEKLKEVPANYLRKYFIEEEDYYEVTPYLKSLVRFDYHNLNYTPTYFSNDLVMCRNVLIYFDRPAQERVINSFWSTMSDYAYLFIGHSESLLGMNTPFKFVRTPDSCFYKKDLKGIGND